MRKKGLIWYCILFLAICLIPSLGMLAGKEDGSAENRRLAAAPALHEEDGSWNREVLKDAGAWFEDHFGWRSKWVTGYALLSGKLFGVSAQSSVIKGSDGWLYYMDSLSDYQGSEQLTERQLYDIAHMMWMVQEQAEKRDIRFAFTIAPNKNSLYDEHMPYYLKRYRETDNNFSRIMKYLSSEGVNYVDLYGTLEGYEEILYHERDSHWNNKGASIAADALLTAAGSPHTAYSDKPYEEIVDFEGDLDKMLYPSAITPEKEIYYDPMPAFRYVEEVEDNFAPKIKTESDAEGGSLVMYRDSFGNALLPFMAENFANGYFSRGVPYQLSDLTIYEADTLIIERAERFLPDMAVNAPVMQAEAVEEDMVRKISAAGIITEPEEGIQAEEMGVNLILKGILPMDSLQTETRIFVRVNGDTLYEAFPVSDKEGREGFQLTLNAELAEGDEVYEVLLYEE